MIDMNYAKEQRIRFIDFLLAHYGKVKREYIVDYFGLGEATATRDIQDYIKLAPHNAVYCTKFKGFVSTASFTRLY